MLCITYAHLCTHTVYDMCMCIHRWHTYEKPNILLWVTSSPPRTGVAARAERTSKRAAKGDLRCRLRLPFSAHLLFGPALLTQGDVDREADVAPERAPAQTGTSKRRDCTLRKQVHMSASPIAECPATKGQETNNQNAKGSFLRPLCLRSPGEGTLMGLFSMRQRYPPAPPTLSPRGFSCGFRL